MEPTSTSEVTIRPSAWDRWLSWKVMVPAVLLMLLITVPVTSRFYFLSFIPPIDEPFDVEAFLAAEVPDDENAMVYFRRAIDDLGITDDTRYQVSKGWELKFGFGYTDEDRAAQVQALRDLLSSKEQVIDVWRRGVSIPGFQIASLRKVINRIDLEKDESDLHTLALFVLAYANRQTVDGKVANAWSLMLDTFRMGNRPSMPSSIRNRTIWQMLLWAENSAVDEHLLAQAQREFHQERTRNLPLSDELRRRYLIVRHLLADGNEQAEIERVHEIRAWMRPLIWAYGEPELSERLIRHGFANALDQCDRPPHLQKFRAGTRGYWEPNVSAASTGKSRPISHRVGPDVMEPFLRYPLSQPALSIYASYLSPHFETYCQNSFKERCRDLQLEIVLSLHRYHRRKGLFPKALSELVDEGLLDEVPNDPVSDPYPQPMSFQTDGTYAWVFAARATVSRFPDSLPISQETGFEMQTHHPGTRPSFSEYYRSR